ncbi:hypothetical protein GIY23_05940 [Allosaccharopolyspora coralli]|uniref:Tellurite resistance protein permease n=1 Tax=Allosaccharopolyspora coralli TaxID=2665642 RepID=A0A5Q3Q3F3_9PSEU|nr:hypothetical protein [Allosaccharopolyspora coralli]QGK69138.1 hypothetical protein GIY23_05940 [Allosaccharopolyspora coralli]
MPDVARLSRDRLRALPPEAGAVVMGLGVVALDSRHLGLPAVWWSLLVTAALAWLVLMSAFVQRFVTDRSRLTAEAARPAALTVAASTGVLGLGACAVGAGVLASGLLVVAVACWLVVLPRVLAVGWRPEAAPFVGGWFLLCVASQSVAALAAHLAVLTRAVWLLPLSAAAMLVGLALYWFVLSRFDLRQIRTGQGDHWVAGGALAISVVSIASLTEALRDLHVAEFFAVIGTAAALVLLTATVCWYLVLLVAECVTPRLRYDLRRWATVFPLGMTCAAGSATATVSGVTALSVGAQVLFWPALIVLCLTGWGALRRVWTSPR